MKFDYATATLPKNTHFRIGRRNAYHQAGHVAAIYYGNNQKNLPAVHFQLALKPGRQESKLIGRLSRLPSKYKVMLEGGRLLKGLPRSYKVATRRLSPAERQLCQSAFEADVINILAGSLAEAKYVALRDDEVFNANLVYLGALKFYDGSMDLAIVNDYMACLIPDNTDEREQKLAELFLASYGFINDRENWLAITRLAEAIHSNPLSVFTYEQLIALLDSTIHEDTVLAKLPMNSPQFIG
jgi:hypothetical protein